MGEALTATLKVTGVIAFCALAVGVSQLLLQNQQNTAIERDALVQSLNTQLGQAEKDYLELEASVTLLELQSQATIDDLTQQLSASRLENETLNALDCPETDTTELDALRTQNRSLQNRYNALVAVEKELRSLIFEPSEFGDSLIVSSELTSYSTTIFEQYGLEITSGQIFTNAIDIYINGTKHTLFIGQRLRINHNGSKCELFLSDIKGGGYVTNLRCI